MIHGAAGAIGKTVAKTFAREGAQLFLSGQTLDRVKAVAWEIEKAGGFAEAPQLDVLDESAVEAHTDAVVKKAGKIHVSFNATGIPQSGIQGIPLAELSLDSFLAPTAFYMRSHFLTARAAARRMAARGSGVLLMHTPEPARLGLPFNGGMAPAWAAMEALNRSLSAEFASHGIRAICLRSNGLTETPTIDVVFGLHAKALGISRDQFQAFVANLTHRKRLSTVAEVAEVAALLASDRASGMTGTVANLTGGETAD